MSLTQLSFTKKLLQICLFFLQPLIVRDVLLSDVFKIFLSVFNMLSQFTTMNEKGTALWKKPRLVLFRNVSTVVGFVTKNSIIKLSYLKSYKPT